MRQPVRSLELVPSTRPWPDDDADANFKADIALYPLVEPMSTIARLAAALGRPEGAIARSVLAKWASAGSSGLLALGPSIVHRLWGPVEQGEAAGTDAARLTAYEQSRQMLSWLRLPIVDPSAAGY